MKKKKPAPKETAAPDKATNSIRVKVSDRAKEQFQALLKDDPDYGGNLSDFFNDCIRSYKFQRNRGEKLRHPIEFVAEA